MKLIIQIAYFKNAVEANKFLNTIRFEEISELDFSDKRNIKISYFKKVEDETTT